MNKIPYALPRNRSIEMMSTTISTNLNCNLACKHCYIQPELLRRKEYIDEATFRRCVEVIIESFHLDPSVSNLHLDVLGGEATLMPFEFWERNLPWVLDQIDSLNVAGVQTEFTFCSNLMWKDDRYLDLLRQFKGNPHMDIAVPFEGPDSNRFGRDMAIFPKYLSRIEALGECNMLNLVLVMGQGLIDLGPEYIIDTFVRRGVTDVTCDMIFPWGSGKAFFDHSQPMYADVADYIRRLALLGEPFGLTVDHLDDMKKSLRTLSRSQNTLNDAYEYHWDHRGELSLNPNQTGTEAVKPYINLNAWDENASLKVVWGNNSELDNKLSFEHDFCRDCDFLQACNAGWYPHKFLEPDVVRSFMDNDKSCPGFKELWLERSEVAFDEEGVTRYANVRRIKRIQRIKSRESSTAVILNEADYLNEYEAFFVSAKAATHVRITNGNLFDCSVRQRLWFYDRLGIQPLFQNGISHLDCEPELLAHSLAGNYHSIYLPDAWVWSFVERYPEHQLSRSVIDALAIVSCDSLAGQGAGYTKVGSGVEVSFQYEDLMYWAFQARPPESMQDRVDASRALLDISNKSSAYLARIAPSAKALSKQLVHLERKYEPA